MTPVRKCINAFTGLAVGTLLGFLLHTLLKAFIGSAWSVAEGGPWPIVYSPYIVLATVGTAVGFFTKIKKTIISCLLAFIIFIIGGLMLMFIAGMFVGGGAIYVVAVIGYIAGGIITFNTIIRNT